MRKNLYFFRLITATALLGTSILPAAFAADADNWPQKTVTWVVPFPPGGAMDVMARSLGDTLSKDLGQAIIVENRPGAGGNIGAQYVATQRPDGHTMMITSIGMATNPHLYSRLSYDPIKDFEPVTLLGVVPNVLVVRADNEELKSVEDVIKAAKAQPGKYTYASAGNGTSIHLAGASFTSLTDTDILHVPYKGSSPAVMDVLAGQVDMMFDSITSAKTHIDSGALRALGLTTKNASATLPDVKPISQLGIADYEVSPWFGVFVPAGTPKPVVDKMNKALVDALQKPEVVQRFASIGAEPIGSSPEEMANHLKAETERWGTLIKEANIQLD